MIRLVVSKAAMAALISAFSLPRFTAKPQNDNSMPSIGESSHSPIDGSGTSEESSRSATSGVLGIASHPGATGATLVRVAQLRQSWIQSVHQNLCRRAVAQTLARRLVEPLTDGDQRLIG